MSEKTKYKVKEMPSASMSEDGGIIVMDFKDDQGKVFSLEFEAPELSKYNSKVLQLTHQAEIQKATSAGHLEVQPLQVVAAEAQESVGGEIVSLLFRTDNGQVYPFALPPNEANHLKNQMTKAIASARKQARKSRH